jgi:PadR family transcriptional regulator PadR
VDVQLKKGLLDMCVLAVLAKGDTYGYELTQRITGVLDTSETALYPVLRRLEAQNLLETYSLEYSGRLRKYYRITAAGMTRLHENQAELKNLKKIIDYIIGGENNG